VRHGVETSDGQTVSESLVRSISGSVVAELEALGHPAGDRLHEARKVFEEVALSDDFVDFLTLTAYEHLN